MNSSSPTHGRTRSSRSGKMRCVLLCHAYYPFADDCAKSLKNRPQKANGGVFGQPACRQWKV